MKQKMVPKFGAPMEILTKDQMKALWGSSAALKTSQEVDTNVCYMCCLSDFSNCTPCDYTGNGGCTVGNPIYYCCLVGGGGPCDNISWPDCPPS